MQGRLETYVQFFALANRASRTVGLTMPGLVANRTFARVLFRDLDAVRDVPSNCRAATARRKARSTVSRSGEMECRFTRKTSITGLTTKVCGQALLGWDSDMVGSAIELAWAA